MNQKLLRDYARLIAKMGGAVKKGDEVWINAQLDQPDFITTLVEECYLAGAKIVKINWQHNPANKLTYKFASVGELGKVDSYILAKYKYSAKKLPTVLHIISDDPDAMKGINQKKMAKARMKSYPKIKPFRDAMDGKYKWCIAAVPSTAWAKKVFPKLKDEEAVEALWNAILTASRVDGNDPIKNWEEHNAFLLKQRNKLESLDLRTLVYKDTNGTDFQVDLISGLHWGGGAEDCPVKGLFNPNIPSEEVFTSPWAGKCEGTLVASKPLSYNGQLIEDFSITFKNGKAVSVKAKKNQEALEQMIKMDEGACQLGEVALIPVDSPISNTGILFYETLFDENAACHVALGAGFNDVVPNFAEKSQEEIKAMGINDSMIHVDFMIGTKNLNIWGIDSKGKKTQIFKDGNWAI